VRKIIGIKGDFGKIIDIFSIGIVNAYNWYDFSALKRLKKSEKLLNWY